MNRLCILAAAAVFATTAAHAQQIVTKYSGIQPNDHPASYTEEYFAQEVGLLTKGAIKIEVYHNTQLGDAVANVQSIRNGTIGFTTVSASNLNQVVPAMDMYSLPFLFKNADHFWWFLAQPEAAELAKPLEAKGIKLLGYLDSGARNFFTDKEVKTPDDLKGAKIRVMASPVMVNTMKALGATGVPVAWSELYTALQTGVVDGEENPLDTISTMKFHEVQKYLVVTEHGAMEDVVLFNPGWWQKLPAAHRATIIKAFDEERPEFEKNKDAAQQAALDVIKASGKTSVRVADEKERARLRDAMYPRARAAYLERAGAEGQKLIALYEQERKKLP
jgi:C4-dicarboxylate-binding protein DctP